VLTAVAKRCAAVVRGRSHSWTDSRVAAATAPAGRVRAANGAMLPARMVAAGPGAAETAPPEPISMPADTATVLMAAAITDVLDMFSLSWCCSLRWAKPVSRD
jgi:hypothetical protein